MNHVHTNNAGSLLPAPSLSVLLPVYNAEQYVGEAVESILNQTYRDFEFVIIDDGSTDGSLEILRRYERQDPRIRLFTRENRGQVPTMNEGIEHCHASLIARMDADDISLPKRFKAQLEYMKTRPEVLACGVCALWIDEEGDPICPGPSFLTHEAIDAYHMSGNGGAICHPSAMIRKVALVKMGGYCEAFSSAEDYDLFLKLAEIGRLGNVNDYLIKYRLSSSSISHKRYREQKKKASLALDQAKTRRDVRFVSEKDSVDSVDEDILSKHRLQTKWAWWALGAGNLRTARKYAVRGLARRPWSPESWRLLYCALRGH